MLCAALGAAPAPVQVAPGGSPELRERVTLHYARLAHAMYDDALRGALALQAAVERLLAAPSPDTLQAARRAWIDARRSYSQTEALRFGNSNVDLWEGNVNAWPIDEGFLDYVTGEYAYDVGNPHARENLVGSQHDLSPRALRVSHEMAGLEPNVATGYHAIEFLLWGQDLNRTPASAGERPSTDYIDGPGCTHGSCARRARYLLLTVRLLVDDLREMHADWREQQGEYWTEFRGLDARERLGRMLVGLGSMGGGELAGERMRAALLAHSQEDEQSCFSDTTHLDLFYNALGIQDLYLGRYTRSDGTLVEGPALSELVHSVDPELDRALRARLEATQARATAIVNAAESGEPFDRQIAAENATGTQRVQAMIDALAAQTESFAAVTARLVGP